MKITLYNLTENYAIGINENKKSYVLYFNHYDNAMSFIYDLINSYSYENKSIKIS